jgi:hypothetical protein
LGATSLGLALAFSLSLAGCAAQSSGVVDLGLADPVVEVGPDTLTAAALLERARGLTLAKPSGDLLADRKRLIEPIIQVRLLLLEALARGFEDESLRRQLRRKEREALVRELERVEIRERIEAEPEADPLAAGGEDSLIAAEFSRRQIAFLDTMKARLHYTMIDSGVELFLARMQAWDAADTPPDAPGFDGTDRFGFSAGERALAIFTFEGGKFTIGDYADYMAGEPAIRVRQRTDRGRVERDLDQYFRHHAYAEVARARGYLDLSGVRLEVERLRERSLIQKLYEAEVALPAPPSEADLRAHHGAHRERFDFPAGSPTFEEAEERVRADWVAEREEERYAALIVRLKARYPITYHEEALRRLPL